MQLLRRSVLTLEALAAGSALVVAAGAAPAVAAPLQPGRLIAAAAFGPARTDGRTIVFTAADGRITLVPATGQTRSSFGVAPYCSDSPPTIASAGGGQALFECGAEREEAFFEVHEEPLLFDLAAHAVHVPAGAAELEAAFEGAEGGSNTFEAVGAYGIRARFMAYHTDTTTVINWHTGRSAERVFDPPSIEDLDRPGLRRRLCAPLRVARAFEPPYALRVRSGKLLLQRCGSMHAQTLARGVADPRLAEGFVSWWNGDARIIRLARCRLRVPVRTRIPGDHVPGGTLFTEHVFADHVRGGLLLSERSRYPGPWRIRLLSLSGACDRASASFTTR